MTDAEIIAWMRARRRGNPGLAPAFYHVTDEMFDALTMYATEHADRLGCDLTIRDERLYFQRSLVMPAPPSSDESPGAGLQEPSPSG